MSQQVDQSAQCLASSPLVPNGMLLPSGSNGPHGVAGMPGSWGISKPSPEPPAYVTWADSHDIDMRYCGIDVRAALLALDLLRSRNPSYEGLRVNNVSTISLIKRMFQLEFGTDLPPAEMLRDMGAKIRSHDAESTLNAVRDMSSSY